MSAEQDVAEFWDMVRRAPSGIPHAPEDRDGHNADLLCRAGKICLESEVLLEAVNFLLAGHPLSGLVRPVVMTLARVIDASVRERAMVT